MLVLACFGLNLLLGSFNSIRNWIGQIQQHADVNVNKILVANKYDVVDRAVSTEEVRLIKKIAATFVFGVVD